MEFKGRYRRWLQSAIALAGIVLAQPLWASCSFQNGTTTSKLEIAIPTLNVPLDAEVGTILYSEQVSAPQQKISCTTNGTVSQGYSGGISAADYQASNPLVGVYATGVPGIGIRATWVNGGTATFSGGTYITPLKAVDTVSLWQSPYTPTFNALVEVVVTGKVEPRIMETSKLIADWTYDNLVAAQLRFKATAVNVMTATCNVVEKNITVPLRTITASDFFSEGSSLVSDIVSDDNFKIQLTECDAGIRVGITLSSSGSSGLIDRNTLKIETGSNAAKGVGIQLFGFYDSRMVAFDQPYIKTTKTVSGQPMDFDFKARYIKTDTIVPGEVRAVATFEISYR